MFSRILQTAIALAAVVLGLASTAEAGETSIGKLAPKTEIRLIKEEPDRVYLLRGSIESGAAVLLRNVIGRTKGGWILLDSDGGDFWILLDSDGGDLEA